MSRIRLAGVIACFVAMGCRSDTSATAPKTDAKEPLAVPAAQPSPAATVPPAAAVPSLSAYQVKGTVAGKPVTGELVESGSRVWGVYGYDANKGSIALRGTRNGRLSLTEGIDDAVTGQLEGTWSGSTAEGTWSHKTRTAPFRWQTSPAALGKPGFRVLAIAVRSDSAPTIQAPVAFVSYVGQLFYFSDATHGVRVQTLDGNVQGACRFGTSALQDSDDGMGPLDAAGQERLRTQLVGLERILAMDLLVTSCSRSTLHGYTLAVALERHGARQIHVYSYPANEDEAAHWRPESPEKQIDF